MKRPGTFPWVLLVSLVVATALSADGAFAQTLKEQLVGTWSYVSVDTVLPDGSRVPSYGPNPQGLASFDGNGRYILLTARSGLPRFAANSRTEGSPEENKAVVQGSIAHFGRYSIDEAGKTITFFIETSTFPNWSGTEQKRPFTLSGDELRWSTPASGGGLAEVVLKRAR